MVAVINTSSSLRNTLHYNENKLKQGVAQLIHSAGLGKDTDYLVLLIRSRPFKNWHHLMKGQRLTAFTFP